MVVYEMEVFDVDNDNIRSKATEIRYQYVFRPLIDDLKILWEDRVRCFNAYKEEYFTLRAILLWTINVFLAYDNLCGCSVKGYKACPICGKETIIRLQHVKKFIRGTRKIFAKTLSIHNTKEKLMVSKNMEVHNPCRGRP